MEKKERKITEGHSRLGSGEAAQEFQERTLEARMECLECGTELPQEARFCANCGVEQGLRCGACEHPLEPGDRFCPRCGQAQKEVAKGSSIRPADPASTPGSSHKRSLILGLVALLGVALIVIGLQLPSAPASSSEPTPTTTAEPEETPEPPLKRPSPPPRRPPPPPPPQKRPPRPPMPLPPAPRPPEQRSPVEDLRRYYALISSDQFSQAYALRSSKSRRETSLGHFKKTWSINRGVYLDRGEVTQRKGSRAKLWARIISTDRDGTQLTPKPYSGSVDMVLENGKWRYDGAEFLLEGK